MVDLEDLLGYVGKPVSDFHIYDRHLLNEEQTHSIIIVMVDGRWEALIVDQQTDKVVKDLCYARNKWNLYHIINDSYGIEYFKERLNEYLAQTGNEI